MKISCDARPDHTFGSKGDIPGLSPHVRVTLRNGQSRIYECTPGVLLVSRLLPAALAVVDDFVMLSLCPRLTLTCNHLFCPCRDSTTEDRHHEHRTIHRLRHPQVRLFVRGKRATPRCALVPSARVAFPTMSGPGGRPVLRRRDGRSLSHPQILHEVFDASFLATRKRPGLSDAKVESLRRAARSGVKSSRNTRLYGGWYSAQKITTNQRAIGGQSIALRRTPPT